MTRRRGANDTTITVPPLDAARRRLVEASHDLDGDAPERESKTSYRKRVEISSAIDAAIRLIDDYRLWAEQEASRG